MSGTESDIEREFTKWVKSRGGVCVKQNPNWYRNVPDRLVVVPGGLCFFLELKRPDGVRRPGQRGFGRSLRRKRIPSYFAESVEHAQHIYKRYEKRAKLNDHLRSIYG